MIHPAYSDILSTPVDEYMLILHASSCWFMTGIIWLVQTLVYPFFKYVGNHDFIRLHQFHMKQITWVVAPMMTIELITAVTLFMIKSNPLFLWNLIFVILIWAYTFLVSVPTHNNLNFENEKSKINLINKNWPRTLMWSFRSLFFVFTLALI